MKTVIEIDKLGYSYGEGWILNDLSLQIEKGDFVAVIGPNGAGKSTLLRLLAGILKPRAALQSSGRTASISRRGIKSAMCRRTRRASTGRSPSACAKLFRWGV